MAIVVYIMSIMMTITIFFWGDPSKLFPTLTWAVAISSMAYLIFNRPKVILFDEGITIVNPFLTITTGWQRVDAIDAKFTMSILVDDKTIYAWAAPAPSRYHSRSIHESDLRGMRTDSQSMIRPGESPRSHSGAATYLARTKLANFRNQNLTGAESRVEFNSNGVAVLLISITAAIALTYLQF
jgi:hypothetical protein